MPPRRKPAPAPAGGLLDWSHSSHFHRDARPCRSCGGMTHLRDDHGHPSHKVCAEAEFAMVVDVARRYASQERL
ncbi:hypothetical protein ACH4Q7_22405 [Streptomyces roseolus]|uniref:hypothetical protein n=1 Tax=Streptomyces roseolus TaxID=67358 RepID=UPI0037915743